MVNNNPVEIINKPDDNDGIYDPVDHNLTDSSDEQTLDEEEYLAARDELNEEEEIKNLEKEKNMPLEELLALYNYEHQNINNNVKINDEENIKQQKEIESSFETTVQNLKLQDSSSESNLSTNSHLHELLQPIVDNGNQEDSVESDPDFILERDNTEWKTTIMVGKEYQVEIPKITSNDDNYSKTPPYENNDNEELLWDPKLMTDDEIVQFLRLANSNKNKSQVKDDAQLLYALMQCDYNVDETLRCKQQNLNYIFDEITPFTDIECLAFEQGLTKYGKDFWKIHHNFVKTRTVKELVHFYYLWKKTERHDAFVIKNRKQKKRYLINPGLTDYMDRFFRDPNNSLKNKENCVKSIPGIINSEQAKTKNVYSNDGNEKIANKITRSKSKLNCF